MIWTAQDLFNAAWLGLQSQGWQRAYRLGCRYTLRKDATTVWHCAWGWVEATLATALPERAHGPPSAIANRFPKSVAAQIYYTSETNPLVSLVGALQVAHDSSSEATMEANMRQLATKQGLSIPGE